MLPIPSVSRRRTCVPSLRYPSVTTVAAAILVVSCLYHIRGFVPPRSQAAPLDRAAKDSGMKVSLDEAIQGDDARTLALDGLPKQDAYSHQENAPAEVDTAIKEKEATGGVEETQDEGQVLRQEEELRDIYPRSDDVHMDESVDSESKVQAEGVDADTVSGSLVTSAVDGDESIRENVQSPDSDLLEKEKEIVDEGIKGVDFSDKDISTDGSETAIVDVSEKEESVSGTTSEEVIDTAEKEGIENTSAEEKSQILDGVGVEGASMESEIRDETESVSAANSESLETAEKLEEASNEELAEAGTGEVSAEVVSRDADNAEINSAEKTQTDEATSSEVSREVDEENMDEEVGTTKLSGEIEAAEKTEVQESDDSAVERKVEEQDNETVERDSETEELSIENAEKLESDSDAEDAEENEGLADLDRQKAEDAEVEGASSEKMVSVDESKIEVAEKYPALEELQDTDVSLDVDEREQSGDGLSAEEDAEDVTGA